VYTAFTGSVPGTSIVRRSSGVGTHAMMHSMAARGTLRLGTSGFSFDGWKHGVFYPEGLKNREMLHYYSTQLSSVEINYTFRRFPTENSLATWRDQAADGFVFTLKANQRITHSKRLRDADDDVRDFLDRAKVLGDRLGCVLFQCPPNLRYDRELIERFVGYLPPGPPAFAMEFRHASWNEAKDLLRDQGIAWCVAETDERDPTPAELSWEPVGYLRLRKTDYGDDELREWAGRIRPALDAGSEVFCYFKHEEDGFGPKMAKRLEAILSGEAQGEAYTMNR
jgi:uncharacterized protein YecE (DUF72 family)